MGQFVNLTSQDGFVVPAWVAQPDGAPRGAVVVLQEIFGVNSHIRAVADRFAARGYLAVAPATFARVQPDVDLGYSEADMGVGFGFKTAVEALPGAGAMPDIQAAIDYAAQQHLSFVEVRDPVAQLSLKDCQAIAAYAAKKKMD